MADTDLVFGPLASGVTTDLVFGETDANPGDTVVTVMAEVPFAVSVKLSFPTTVAITAPIPLQMFVNLEYRSGASRPTVSETTARWQGATRLEAGVKHGHTAALRMPVAARVRHQQADPLQSGLRARHRSGQPVRRGVRTAFQQGVPMPTAPVPIRHQDGYPVRNSAGGRFQQAERVPVAPVTIRHQDGLRDRRNHTAGRWQQGVRQSVKATGSARVAAKLTQDLIERHQQAMKPPPGIWDRVIPEPPKEPCYTPSPHLLFSALWDGSPHLVFVCDNHGGGVDPNPPQVIVPVRKVYVVINDTSLWRVDGSVHIPTYSLSMSLDVDSWSWSFNASVPAAALPDLEPQAFGEPVELEARINGNAYRLLAERLSRDRVFANSRISVSGRGKSALLDSPYSPTRNFSPTSDMTAQQLMNDVLTENGVSIGWDVDWGLTDWLVPENSWAAQASYIQAVNAIAQAAGGYVQPHRTDQVLRILARYPVAPWNWEADVTPDFEIPSAVMQREGIEWTEKARYNRVFVSGQANGVLGQVTRAGTPGDVVAPMVTDSLITAVEAATQRGTAILSDTGRQARVSLRMPVLAETGVIEPGKFIRYVDGGITRLGIVRSTSVEVAMPETWQSLDVETHIA